MLPSGHTSSQTCEISVPPLGLSLGQSCRKEQPMLGVFWLPAPGRALCPHEFRGCAREPGLAPLCAGLAPPCAGLAPPCAGEETEARRGTGLAVPVPPALLQRQSCPRQGWSSLGQWQGSLPGQGWHPGSPCPGPVAGWLCQQQSRGCHEHPWQRQSHPQSRATLQNPAKLRFDLQTNEAARTN